MLNEGRKYGVGLTLAHQYLEQFDTRTRKALGTVGSTIIFEVNETDAGVLAKNLQGRVKPQVLTTLPVGKAIARVDADIVRINTPKPKGGLSNDRAKRVVEEPHRRYYRPIDEIRQQLRRRRERAKGAGRADPEAITLPANLPKQLPFDEL